MDNPQHNSPCQLLKNTRECLETTVKNLDKLRAERRRACDNWKVKTCEHCFFRLYSYCHRFPPAATDSDYPKVWCAEPGNPDEAGWSAACAEYRDGG